MDLATAIRRVQKVQGANKKSIAKLEQPLMPVNFEKENCDYPIGLVIINIVEKKCPLSFINNSMNGINLQPNRLIAEVKFKLEELKITFASPSNQEDNHSTLYEPINLLPLIIVV
uniref:Uncharacterized protein n=1 Tax=Romanomermis culicivorax TaxID=13658 RepID=A0A915KW77_ROMCU